MALHSTTIYGPVHSRRLGTSLGVNLLPAKRKVCNFECIYCECGWTDTTAKDRLPTLGEFTLELAEKLAGLRREAVRLDFITFAGNGEPTLHPEFAAIIDRTVALRSEWMPHARIGVLSNATTLQRPAVAGALRRIDDPMFKLDAGTESMFGLIDLPQGGLTLERLTEDIAGFGQHAILQSMFLKGTYRGQPVDNTIEEEVDAWVQRVDRIRPRKVMLYSIDRRTPAPQLSKVAKADLERIADRVRAIGIAAETFA